MRDYLNFFEKTMEDYSSAKKLQIHLVDLVESLYKDLENERLSTANLQKQIQELTKEDVFCVTSKFAALKDEYAALEEKLNALKNENDDLNIQLIARSQETKRIIAEKEDEVKTLYEHKLKQKNEEIVKKQQEVEVIKAGFKQKERDLFTDFQVSQASMTLQLDTQEADFLKQLKDSGKKLKDSMDTCNTLRIELMTIKEQFAEYKKTSNERISELQKRIREISNGEPVSLVREDVRLNSEFDISTSSDKSNKYKALDVSCKSVFNLEERPINLKKVPVYRGSGKSSYTSNVAANALPPLVKLKDKTTKENDVAIKKRKLYNPEDLSYLEVIAEKE